MTEAIEKFKWAECKGQSLCAWFTEFLNSKRKDFKLEILPPGDIGVWKWAGEDIAIPIEKSLELGDFMASLRSCLDIAIYEMSQKAIKRGIVKSYEVKFPILRSSNLWKNSTVSWLSQSNRQRVKKAQRFGERRDYDMDIVLINSLSNCDKHRSIVSVLLSSAACGQIGGENAVSFAWAKDLGLGSRDTEGWHTAVSVQVSCATEKERDKFELRGPLGGLALMGTIPTMQLRFSNDLELDNEDDKRRLAQVSVVEAIYQSVNEVRSILGILLDETEQVTEDEMSSGEINDHKNTMPSATEYLQIYKEIPPDASLRTGWTMHLKEIKS